MTIKEAILTSLDDIQNLATHNDVYNHIVENRYYSFDKGKTPEATISAQLGSFIRNDDSRIRRVKGTGNYYLYYLSKYEQSISNLIDTSSEVVKEEKKVKKTYYERDLHKLLSSYLKNKNVYSKTILHEESKNTKDEHQKWIHPDMIGIEFLHLTSKVNNAFMKILNKADTFKITSYEIKREINTDYELKKYYFQAVSNSSWANYGYLAAHEISNSLKDEMERLNQSFGIGIIELKSNPYESKILFQSKFKELDFKTIDKLCRVNKKYESFIELTEKTLSASERYYTSAENELENFCDDYFRNDSEIEEYCKMKNISID
ncbi:MAG: hypothetical protein ACI9TV_001314 [Sulfurimonas sp.]|jgi:hypothetical protein|uniref:hypothetical protein n=1 Tax=Sulfurimonas sp. TaxID=2022749 RepID=UPI0039E347E4